MRSAADHSCSRRRALSFLVNSVMVVSGGALATLLGAFAARPAATTNRQRWRRAGSLHDLIPGVPAPRVVAVLADDGWYRARSRRNVFLVRDGAKKVRALSATCTHLGCQVRWNGEAGRFVCPCHGGAYDADGRVVGGPPPRGLDEVPARVDDADDSVLVQL